MYIILIKFEKRELKFRILASSKKEALEWAKQQASYYGETAKEIIISILETQDANP